MILIPVCVDTSRPLLLQVPASAAHAPATLTSHVSWMHWSAFNLQLTTLILKGAKNKAFSKYLILFSVAGLQLILTQILLKHPLRPETKAVISTCRLHNLWPFVLGINACRVPDTHCTSSTLVAQAVIPLEHGHNVTDDNDVLTWCIIRRRQRHWRHTLPAFKYTQQSAVKI